MDFGQKLVKTWETLIRYQHLVFLVRSSTLRTKPLAFHGSSSCFGTSLLSSYVSGCNAKTRKTCSLYSSNRHVVDAQSLTFEMELLSLEADSERKMLCLLSATKPNSSISKPNNHSCSSFKRPRFVRGKKWRMQRKSRLEIKTKLNCRCGPVPSFPETVHRD